MVPSPDTSSALRRAFALASAGFVTGSLDSSLLASSGVPGSALVGSVVSTAVVGQILVGLLVIPD